MKAAWIRHRVLTAFLAITLIVFFSSGVFAENEIHFSNHFSTTFNGVTGSGGDRSSLTEKIHYLNIFSLYGKGSMDDFDYNFKLSLKGTNDERNDIEELTLTSLQGRATNGIHTLTLGDTFESFSKYSMGTVVKGGSYTYADDDLPLPDLSLVYGYVYPRWDNFTSKVEAIERKATGIRLQQDLSPSTFVGCNYTRAWDRESERVFSTDNVYDVTILSFDAESRPIQGLILSGEYAASRSTTNIEEGADDIHARDSACKISAIGYGGPSRVTLEYERVEPLFTTLLGSATPDREKVKTRWRYKYSRHVYTTLGFLWYRNHLSDDSEKTDRSDYFKPNVGLTLKRLFGRRYLVVDLASRLTRSYTSGRSTTDQFYNLNCRDRFFTLDSDTNLGYAIYDTNRDIRKDRDYMVNTSLSSRYTLGKVILKPNIYAGGQILKDELQEIRDKTYEYSLGLGFDIPEFKITSNMKIGQNRLEKETGDSSKKVFGNVSFYCQPAFLKKLNKGMLYVRGYVNDFNYTTTTRDFRETSITAGVRVRL